MSKQANGRIKVTILDDERKIDCWLMGEVTGGYRFYAKMFDGGSEYGINKGRVSKLEIRNDGKTLVNYDRGWDVKPQTSEVKAVYNRIMAKLKALDKVTDVDKPKDLLAKIEDNKQKVSQSAAAKHDKAKGEELC